jgi:sigma-B regulation protein RsbU (phosphoserine phosphatase)
MQKSLSARLTYRIMAVVLVMMVAITGVVYFTVRKYMLDEAKERYLGFLLENHQEIRRKLSDVHVAAINNVHDIERDIDNPDRMFDHMERIVRQNLPIVCCAILFRQDYYPSKGRVFVPCARRNAADSVVVSRIDSTYNSYFYSEWFQNQLKADESCWTKPYFESQLFAGNQEPRLLTTYTVPIHDRDGHPVALLAADMSLEWLRNELMEDIQEINSQYEKGLQHQSYFFIVNRDGTIIIHPDKQRMLTQFDKNVGKAMLAHRGTCVTEVDGVKSRLYYRSFKYVNWTMVIVAPEDVILSNAKMLNIIILAVMIMGLLAIYLFCRRQIKEIADPFAAKKAVMERELNIAHNIQMALLPQSFPEHSDLDLYATQTPARDVGGDLYDYFVHDGRLVFCIGDVSGKGVPAALLMAVMRSMFRSEARRAESAADVVETMSRNLCEEYTGGEFVTMFVGVLDLSSGRLDYCNAGHEPPLVSGQPMEVKRNLPVGALSDWVYEGGLTQLKPGDTLFLYTDGLSETKNSTGELLGRKHVQQLAIEHATDTARQLVELMEAEVHRHAGDAEQNDDITMLAIKWQPNQMMMRASMDDISSIEPFISLVAKQAGMEGREAKRLRLAVEEAVANIINHGQATAIRLQAKTGDGQLVLTIDDDGQPFDPTADSATDFSVPADQRPPGGLGIMILHQMTDGLEYQRHDGHNVLKIIKCKKVKR